MITVGDNPQGIVGINKFIDVAGEGLRGKIIALHESGKLAIILAQNTAVTDGNTVQWGRLYLIRETDLKEYPSVVYGVNGIPQEKEWTIL